MTASIQEIAIELSKNSSTLYKQVFSELITKLEELKKGNCNDIEVKNLYFCLDFISKSNFDITGWKLHQIPIYYAFCFNKKETNEWFDLNVYNGNVKPGYLDNATNEKDALSIEETISNYCIPN